MIVYKATNKDTGKSYVGVTSKTLKYRWRQHVLGHNKSSLLSKSIKKHGEEVFSLEILFEASSKEELSKMEDFFIKKFDTLIPNGYNLQKGGLSTHEFQGRGKGRKFSKEHKEKLGESKKGSKNPRFGKTPSNARSVIGWKDNNSWYFKSVSEAEKFGFSAGNIVAVCRGRLKTHKGYRWEYFPVGACN